VQTIHVEYTRDASGALIGQTQTIHEVGVDTDGVAYTSDTIVNYTIFQGEGKILDSISTTVTTKEDGSKDTSITKTDYAGCYDAGGSLVKAPTGTRTSFGNTAKYTDDAGVVHAATTYAGTYDLTYKLMAGSAVTTKMDGSTTTSTWDEAAKVYVETNTTSSTVTYEYIQINGNVLTKSTNAVSETIEVAADANGNHYTASSNIITTYEYDQTTGALTGAKGTGTGSGYSLQMGNMQYNSTITVTYRIANGIAVQTDYLEIRTARATPTPGTTNDPGDTGGDSDPAVQGTIQDTQVVASGLKADGTRDYYVYVVVYASAFDDTIGDGEWEEKDGEQYLVRINCGSDKAKADSLAASYISQRGTVRSFFGNIRPNTNIIDALGNGAGPFDLPGL
jgi:hypothetical protein